MEISSDLLPVLIILRDLAPRNARLKLEMFPERQQDQNYPGGSRNRLGKICAYSKAQEFTKALLERLQNGMSIGTVVGCPVGTQADRKNKHLPIAITVEIMLSLILCQY